VLGISGPDASAALRLAAKDGVMHADEELLLDEEEEVQVLPTTTPLVLVVAVCWLWELLVLPVVADEVETDELLLLDSADTLEGLGGALLFLLLSTASALDAGLTGDGWW
jgi:hypothetical protein